MNLQARIKSGQRRHERTILARIRKANKAGALWNTGVGWSFGRDWKARNNAIDRLIKAGKIEHVAWRGPGLFGGYRLVGFRLADADPKYRGRQWKNCDSWGRAPSDPNFGR